MSASSMLERYDALDRALVAKGFPATSPWWLETIRRFYESGRRQLVLRVGRRGGKSSTLCRLAVLEALYGSHFVPPGDIGVVAFISTRRDEASQRLRTIKAILDALGVGYRPIEDGVELAGRAIAFKVLVASIAGVSGPTCICVVCDEVAKWKDADTGANPATEVLASLRPTLATQPRAKIILSSSPLGLDDAHAVAFDEGDTAFQLAAHAPTWIANPSVSEKSTHELEKDERIHRREYAAVPQAGVLAAFDVQAIDRAFEKTTEGADPAARVLVIDPSSGGGDSFTYATAHWMIPPARPHLSRRVYLGRDRWAVETLKDERGEPVPDPAYVPGAERPFIRLENIGAFEGGFWGPTSGLAIVSKLATLCKSLGISRAYGDQRESLMLASEFARHGVVYTPIAWTAQNKPEAVERVRGWMREGALSLEKNDKLRSELLAFDEKITPSGQITFAARGRRHDDHVALLISTALADLEGGVPASPSRPQVYRYLPPHIAL